MIVEDNVIEEWKIYSAQQFEEAFKIEDKWDGSECDEDYIMRHLESDTRNFRVTFMEDARDNAYEEYWLIQEIEV